MQIFKKIDRKKTKLFSIENLIHCFCARLYILYLHLRDDKPAKKIHGDQIISAVSHEVPVRF